MKKKPDRKLVIATLVLLAGVASASFSKGPEHPGFKSQQQHETFKKSLMTGAFRA